MRKELIRETMFGKSVARIKVSGAYVPRTLDGIEVGEDFILTSEIFLLKDGKVIERTSGRAEIMDSKGYKNFFERNKLDKDMLLSKAGKYQAIGKEYAEEINNLIQEMRDEITVHFGEKTDAENKVESDAKRRAEEIEEAEYIIYLAEKEGVNNLLSRKELAVWRKEYNDLQNEGGDGYIPPRVSKEEYGFAVKALKGGK